MNTFDDYLNYSQTYDYEFDDYDGHCRECPLLYSSLDEIYDIEVIRRHRWCKDEQGNGTVHKAVQSNRTQMLSFLLKNGFNVNEINETGETALHVAVRDLTAVECVDILLRNKCDVNLKNQLGQTALMLALSQSDDEDRRYRSKQEQLISKLLKASELKYNEDSIKNYFILAVMHGNTFAVKKFLLKVPKLLHYKDGKNQAIHLAAMNGQNQVISTLLNYGANINTKGCSSSTPIHFAAELCKLSTIEYLVSHRAKCNEVDDLGNTVLHIILERCFSCCIFSKCSLIPALKACRIIDSLYKKLPEKLNKKCVLIAVAVYLIMEGKCSILNKNNNGKTPFEMIATDSHDRLAVYSHLQKISMSRKRLSTVKCRRSLELKSQLTKQFLNEKCEELVGLKKEIDYLRQSMAEKDSEIRKLKEMILKSNVV